jgi:hypothetical protein
MRTRQILAVIAAITFATTSAWADTKDDVAAAVKKLGDAPNYTFTSTTENQGGFGGGPQVTKGQVDKAGYATLSVPLFAFGGDAPPPLDVVVKGNNTVAKMPTGWKTQAELAAAPAPADAGGGFNFGPEQQAIFALSNVALPATTAKDATAKLDNLKKENDVISADLPADTAKTLLAFRGGAAGQPAPEVTSPKGSIKLTLKDGAISKLVLHLTGSMDFGGMPFDIDRTTTIELKDVGTTKVTVPEDAKKKLDAAPAATAKP